MIADSGAAETDNGLRSNNSSSKSDPVDDGAAGPFC
jgi:hypothetical protein